MCLARSQGGIYKGDDLGQLISESAIINTLLQESQTTHRRYNNTLLLYSERTSEKVLRQCAASHTRLNFP